VTFPLKIQIKLQKTRSWKEKSVENMITLAGLPINSRLIFFSYLTLKKLNLYLAKLGSYFEFALFCNGFTLVPTAHATLDV
jgi:hypothetical protein